jgi:hypothetical protein
LGLLKSVKPPALRVGHNLTKDPKIGDAIVGSGGVRKVRVRSSSGGKSGGLRICYFYYQIGNSLYLLWIYAKNDQEDLTAAQRKIIKEFIDEIKKK